MSTGKTLSIALLYPTVLGLYGDRGNAAVLQHRAAARQLQTELLEIEPGTPVPTSADIYLLGGGEDLAQTTACDLLRADGGLASAAARGAVIFAVCAGMQLLGSTFPAKGATVAGLDLVDLETIPGSPRAVGELLCDATIDGLPTLTGYENHGGRTRIGEGTQPLGRVRSGIGNGVGDGTEGIVAGNIIGTYLHGPALVRNPALADLLLSWATGQELAPFADPLADALYQECVSRK
jgi:lipid II isoglutaminyl synthase (glutamine-hydrolysing)